MSDLIERLRDWEHVWSDHYCKPDGAMYIEAADALERMQWNTDMEAANKKSSIIAVDMSDMNTLALAKWRQHNGIWAWRNPDGFIIEATHWMNLPEGE